MKQHAIAQKSEPHNCPVVEINPNVPLTTAQAKARYVWTGDYQNGKPVFWVPTRQVISHNSAFEHKKLCDGLTFSLGLACYFSCLYCYVGSLFLRHSSVQKIMKQTGLSFAQIAIKRDNPLPLLFWELIGRNGKPRYGDPTDRRTIFGSPIVDVAASLATAQQTVAACELILQHTNWDIRLLSKSASLRAVAEQLEDYKGRVIYGLSTGTFQDHPARSFELHTSSPSARLRTLHWLQDHDYRTYAMLCPILPQRDYAAYATEAIEKIRVEKCEHVWAEVLNVRGRSLSRTCAGLRRVGFDAAADLLVGVSGPNHKADWEAYARATFLSLAKIVPAEKLRFLQYVQPGQLAWWQEQQHFGAVLLGAHAQTGRKGAAQS